VLPLLVAAAVAAGTPPAATSAPRVPSHTADAAAMKAVAAAATKVEACRARTLDYTRCDDRPLNGARMTASTVTTYAVAARSRAGRRFVLARSSDGRAVATCSPRGRGGCGRRGTWKPRPTPVMNPAFGEEWLAHERELVARLLALTEVIDRCYDTTGDFTRCRTDEMEAARRWEMLWGPPGVDGFGVDLEERNYIVSGMSRASTRFVYVRSPHGVERWCEQPNPHIKTPCAGERW
jgi:hypothetical protein